MDAPRAHFASARAGLAAAAADLGLVLAPLGAAPVGATAAPNRGPRPSCSGRLLAAARHGLATDLVDLRALRGLLQQSAVAASRARYPARFRSRWCRPRRSGRTPVSVSADDVRRVASTLDACTPPPGRSRGVQPSFS